MKISNYMYLFQFELFLDFLIDDYLNVYRYKPDKILALREICVFDGIKLHIMNSTDPIPCLIEFRYPLNDSIIFILFRVRF